MAEKKVVAKPVNPFAGTAHQATLDFQQVDRAKLEAFRKVDGTAPITKGDLAAGRDLGYWQRQASGLNSEAAARYNKQAELNKLSSDVGAGLDFGASVIGEGLGRLEGRQDIEGLRGEYANMLAAAKQRAGQSADIRNITNTANTASMQDIESRLRAAADQGFTGEESQAMREKAMEEINRGTQTASRRTQALLGTAGVKGAVAGRQLLDVEMQGAQQKANVNRDLFLEGENLRRQGLSNLASFGLQRGQLDLSSQQAGVSRDIYAENAALQRQQAASNALQQQASFTSQIATFDIAQANKEKDILMQSGLGFAMMGNTNAAANASILAARSQSSGSGGTIICTELLNQGRISRRLRREAYLHSLDLGGAIYVGYLRWATPVVKLMKCSRIFSRLVEAIFKPAIYHMAGHETKFGKVIYTLGLALSKALKFKEK